MDICEADLETFISPVAAPTFISASDPPPQIKSKKFKPLKWLDRHRRILFLGLGIIYLLGFNGQWQIEPDSALYLELARNIARGQGYTYHQLPHNLVYPGLPYVLSFFFRLFPNHFIVACDIFMLLTAWLALALTYRLFLLACNRPTAVAVTILTGIAHEFFRYGFEIMADMPFLVGIMGVLAGYEAIFRTRCGPRWWDWLIFGFGSIIAIITKPMMLVLMPICIIGAIMEARRQKAIGRAFAACSIIIILVAAFFTIEPRHPFAPAGSSYEQVAARELMGADSQFPWQIERNLADLLGKSATRCILGIDLFRAVFDGIFSMIIIIGGIALWRFRPVWGIWIAVTIAKMAILFSHDRYFIPILPLMMFGWWQIMRWVALRAGRQWGKTVFWVLVGITFSTNFVRSSLVVVRQHEQPFVENYRGGTYSSVVRLADQIPAFTGSDDVILAPTDTSRIFTFLSDRTVLEPASQMVDLKNRRLFVIRNSDGADPKFDEWLSRLEIQTLHQPLITVANPPVKGGSLALYPVAFKSRLANAK
jgi:hypothetical protein